MVGDWHTGGVRFNGSHLSKDLVFVTSSPELDIVNSLPLLLYVSVVRIDFQHLGSVGKRGVAWENSSVCVCGGCDGDIDF